MLIINLHSLNIILYLYLYGHTVNVFNDINENNNKDKKRNLERKTFKEKRQRFNIIYIIIIKSGHFA